ncbi:MAG TPA: hypothetical protein VNZ48_19395 [Xanthobacteraceae bacterium]|nr:hypothetical protein [Xanthobacteraceae bacterium]
MNGPINFNIMGPCATLTFTVARGELDQLMKGQQLSKLSATVVSRVTMPVQLAAELRNLLNKLIQDQPIAPGSNLTQ